MPFWTRIRLTLDWMKQCSCSELVRLSPRIWQRNTDRPNGKSPTVRGRDRPFTGGPPHRSQRALLTHWAPTSGHDAQSLFGIRVQCSMLDDFHQPSVVDGIEESHGCPRRVSRPVPKLGPAGIDERTAPLERMKL